MARYYVPHLDHLYAGSFGRSEIPRKPAIEGRVQKAMKISRRLGILVVTIPMKMNQITLKTLRGIPYRMTSREAKRSNMLSIRTNIIVDEDIERNALNPKLLLRILPNVVRPPFGTELKNALSPVNQN